METLALHISIEPRTPWSEIAIAWLSDEGCNAFEESANGIVAYGESDQILMKKIEEKLTIWSSENKIKTALKVERIPQQNWNALWESDFHPVEVENYLTILAPFHEKAGRKGMLIEIQPQMSFGTGHHQTTWMMSKALFEYGPLPSAVLDMGTGTGILAILAEKLGSTEILAIDIEEWSAQNTKENALRNVCSHITTLHGDVDLILGKKFGLILANINKNVLKSQMSQYASTLSENGRLIISGFFETDKNELIEFAQVHGFLLEKSWNKESWAAIQFKKVI
jgi:ribosomal protein L11 methyltransferase